MWDRWVERVYTESDFGRSMATFAAGLVGLIVYLLKPDIAIAGFSALIVFPVVRVLASAAHSKAERLAKVKAQEDGLEKLYNRLSPDEKHVVSVFVRAGGSVMTWAQMNNSGAKSSAIGSLGERGLLRTSAAADGLTETFVLDQDLFDIGQTNYDFPF